MNSNASGNDSSRGFFNFTNSGAQQHFNFPHLDDVQVSPAELVSLVRKLSIDFESVSTSFIIWAHSHS